MNYDQAKEAVSRGENVALVTRDATGQHWTRLSVWEKNGELFHRHPTDGRVVDCHAPKDGRYEVQPDPMDDFLARHRLAGEPDIA